MLYYTDENTWDDEETGRRFVWNGSLTVKIYDGTDTSWVESDILTFMQQPTRAQVQAAIGRRLRGE